MQPGLDYLGLGSRYWPLALSIQVFPSGWDLGAFDTEFGDVLPNLRKFLASGKVRKYRAQMYWGGTTHKIAPLDLLTKRLPLYERLQRDFPNVQILISHSCEYKEQNRNAIQQRIDLVKKLAPSCGIVQTPMASPVVPLYPVEGHGDKANIHNCARASLDGTSTADIDMGAWIHAQGEQVGLLWAPRFNLRQQEDPPTPQNPHPKKNPPAKLRTAAPNAEYFKDVIATYNDPGVAPAFTGQGIVKPFLAPQIWKTMAEDKVGNNDPRANKPCLIIKENLGKGSKVQVVDHKGNRVGYLGWYGPYKTLWRYYSGQTGSGHSCSEFAETAVHNSGSPYVWFKVGNVNYGPVNPARRAGVLR